MKQKMYSKFLCPYRFAIHISIAVVQSRFGAVAPTSAIPEIVFI